MQATTDQGALVAHATALVKDAIREGRSRCKRGTQPDYVRQLAKDALSPERTRSRCVEQFLAFVVDIAQRGELVDAEEIGLRVIAVAREASGKNRPDLSLAEAHAREEAAEGDVEDAEIQMAYPETRGPSAYARFLRCSAVHTSARRDLENVVRSLQLATV
jgi:hypothetical protein